ncbi:RmlC-like jelly roll fold protein [Ophiocordyceps sinensis CO18]|nr:RmlC-like jelly roll fold protein [Ophiocordyceps sinensis CO18]
MFHNSNFVLPSIKEVVRVAPDAPPSKRAPGSKSRAKAGSNSKQAVVEDEELEEWEVHPGTVTGEVVVWKPEHEEHPPGENDDVDIEDDRVAISADAIQTSDIKDATFRFAKTLSLPFMGAGVVDLPPGAEKRPKNSRKMHMVFFVHYGKVLVTINETQFRISAGGMWFVPRGNYYSITNDFDNHARIFFSQGNEVRPSPADASPAPSATPLGY